MKTTVETLSPTRVKLTLDVTPEDLKPSIDHAYEHIAQSVNIPGFRRGKVPPQLIDQRVGREEVLQHAVNDGLDRFYRDAAAEQKIKAIGRPQADIVTWPEIKDFSGDLVVTIEVDVRPEVELPAYDKLTLTVDPIEVSADDVKDELDNLRSRFGTLVTVDRPAKSGDFAQLDLTASIGDNEVDSATSISYEVGSGELIEGIDEALDGLSAGETTTFESTLLGGDHEGETALITVNLLAVKERELPEADDDFAQIASQFDTIKELKADIKEQVEKSKSFGQGAQARDQIVDLLLEQLDIPVPPKLVEDEVHRHLENENRLEDDVHRAEVQESSEKTFRTQILLDAIVEAEGIKVGQNELTTYLVQSAAQYGMEPGEFIQVLDKNGQIPSMVAEVARSKALATVLSKAKVVDTKGKKVDVSAFTAPLISNDDDTFIETSDFAGDPGHQHDNGNMKDSHGRKPGHEHYGHDHS
ncbi:trigger factor [Microbacteriaceae bacterium SG_E_30_P1]|uniref:Trigger factor n=1 Tax=Antiquaquibacter oligotrophicus TaxID=2880260 RepID=A0ABT6KNC7_9MICO|nr:trigger factor [Antiquaquibacter oligotrophicus]MDH6181255.1 trigger factor [Antiquaquibacter oligotrophicus]UDF13050.1 trigger factor [Antiquaquibacter oligotrophicus]